MRHPGFRRSFLPVALLASLLFLSCRSVGSGHTPEDDPSPTSVSGSLSVYGLDIKLSGATLKRLSNQRRTTIEEFKYTHSYNRGGKKVTNTLTGQRAGNDVVNYCYYTLTFYEPGIGFDDLTQNISGSGAVVTFHIYSEPGASVPTGKLKWSKDPVPGTFKAYYSSTYDASKPNLSHVALVKTGTLELQTELGKKIKAVFALETNSGTKVTGSYEGNYKELTAPDISYPHGEGIIIRGFTPTYLLQVEENGVIVQQGVQPSGSVLESMLNTGKGKSLTGAEASQIPDLIDIMLLKNTDSGDFTFTSPAKNPVADQEYVWGIGWLPLYRYFPNTTYYQKAPSDFTDRSYEALDTDGFDFQVRKDEFLTLSPGYRGYVFFSTTQGMKGVIKIEDYAKPEVIRKLYYGTIYQLYHMTDGFVVNYKVEAAPVVPLIG